MKPLIDKSYSKNLKEVGSKIAIDENSEYVLEFPSWADHSKIKRLKMC